MMLDSPHTSAPMLMRGNDTARLTRHTGVPGRRRRVGRAAADSPSHFSSPWAPGEARSRRCSRVKQAHNGSRRAKGGTRPTGDQYFSDRKKSVHDFPAHTLLSALPLCEVGAARTARWRILPFHVRIGPQKLSQRVWEVLLFISLSPHT